MAQLIDLKETIRNYYQRYEEYIRPAMKLVFSFFILLFLSMMFAYDTRINRFYIFLLVSVIQAFLPISFLYFAASVLVAVNLWTVSPEIMLVFLMIMIAGWLTFGRINKYYTILVLLTPVLFFLKLEYLLPVLVGMTAGIGGILPAACGVFVYFISSYITNISAALAATTGNTAGVGLQRIFFLASNDKTLLVVLIAFSVIIFISAVLYRMFHESAWMFAVVIGNIALALLLLSGRLIFELDYTIWRVFIECVLAAGLGIVYQFFRGIGDVSRIEKVSFEDDEYIYYVRAVPKIRVPVTERNVTRITPEDTDSFDMPREEPAGVDPDGLMKQSSDRKDSDEHRTYTESN